MKKVSLIVVSLLFLYVSAAAERTNTFSDFLKTIPKNDLPESELRALCETLEKGNFFTSLNTKLDENASFEFTDNLFGLVINKTHSDFDKSKWDKVNQDFSLSLKLYLKFATDSYKKDSTAGQFMLAPILDYSTQYYLPLIEKYSPPAQSIKIKRKELLNYFKRIAPPAFYNESETTIDAILLYADTAQALSRYAAHNHALPKSLSELSPKYMNPVNDFGLIEYKNNYLIMGRHHFTPKEVESTTKKPL